MRNRRLTRTSRSRITFAALCHIGAENMGRMHRLCWLSVLLFACGDSATGTPKPDAGVEVDADADAAPPDAPDMPFVTYPAATLTDDAATAKKWASGSAPQLYMLAYTPTLVAEAELQIGGETCPAKTVSGTTTTYTGGCTTMEGTPWTGTATATTGATGQVVYTDFGGTGTDTCNDVEYPSTFKYNGTITPSATEAGTLTIKIIAEITGPDEENSCQPHTGTLAIDYTLTLRKGTHDADGDGTIDDTFWNGSGRYGNSVSGAVDVMTTEEKLEQELCEDEALAGDTKISSGGHMITITYDGATDCDVESTVHWAYDGTDRGEIAGVSCAAGGSPGGALVLVVVVGAVTRRRRRRR
jgi:MYXO-CTERM domain-containing protein